MKKIINWLLPVKYEFFYLIEDLDNYEDSNLEGVFNIPVEFDAATIIKFHINGVELPDNNDSIEITIP